MQTWVEEVTGNFYGSKYQVKEILFQEKSAFQTVAVVDTTALGKMLLNDGLVMTTERDEFVYHEMISHVPLFAHPNPQTALIIGGGDGGTAREILKHDSIQSCTLVEIDEVVVRASKEFLPETACSYADKRLHLHIADGVQFVKDTQEKYDLVIVDSTDPIGPATPLFGREFYNNIKKCLNPNGIVISQAESPFYTIKSQSSLYQNLKELFSHVSLYNYSNLTYPGFLYSFSFASMGITPFEYFDPDKVHQSAIDFKYYNPEIHRAAFSLPTFQLRNLEGRTLEKTKEFSRYTL